MDKLRFMKIVNVCLFLSLVTQASVGVLFSLRFKFALGDFWTELHEINGYVLMGLVATHITLFWPIVRSHYFPKRKTA